MTTTTRLDLSLQMQPIKITKHCQKCHGNLALERDDDTRAPFLSCIQCGREHDLNGELKRTYYDNKRSNL